MDSKDCTRCKEVKLKNLENFPPHNKKKDGLDSWCRKCRASYRSEINRGKFRDQLSDDEVRKLCSHCNRGLGNFKDNINTLQAAIEYLKERDNI